MNDTTLPSEFTPLNDGAALNRPRRRPRLRRPVGRSVRRARHLGHQRLARCAARRRPPVGRIGRHRHQRLPAAPPLGRLPPRRIVDQPGPRLGGRTFPPLLPDRAPAHRQHAELGAGPADRPADARDDRVDRPLRLAVRRPRARHRHHGRAAARGHAGHLARGDGDAVAGADLAGVLHGHRPAAGRAAGQQRPRPADHAARARRDADHARLRVPRAGGDAVRHRQRAGRDRDDHLRARAAGAPHQPGPAPGAARPDRGRARLRRLALADAGEGAVAAGHAVDHGGHQPGADAVAVDGGDRFDDRGRRPRPDGAARHRPARHGPGDRGRPGHRAAGDFARPADAGDGQVAPQRGAPLVAHRACRSGAARAAAPRGHAVARCERARSRACPRNDTVTEETNA
jgi:hypothetical protein